MLTPNVGKMDSAVRAWIAVLLIFATITPFVRAVAVKWFLLAAALVFASALFSTCLIYKVLGINTVSEGEVLGS